MKSRREILLSLAANRDERLDGRGRPVFNLTPEELEASAHTAMRVADASRSRIAEREQLALEVC